MYRKHSSHWGAFSAQVTDGTLDIKPFEGDPDPSPILNNFPAALNNPARLTKPLVRRGWLADGPGPDARRGTDDYVVVEWPEALELAASELKRLGAGPDWASQEKHPGEHIFGGSYGWSSAGRFNHAQSQVHRFLNSVYGGYVASVDTYSSAAGAVIHDLVLGNSLVLNRDHPYWSEIVEHTDVLLLFGGMPTRNLNINPGGNSEHTAVSNMQKAAQRGCEFVSVSPISDDIDALPNTTHIAPRPGTDTALMLGMAWWLHQNGRVNQAYLDRYTVGYAKFEAYLLGASDGVAKTPEWASRICGVSSEVITDLAAKISGKRTMITTSFALQRSRNGEQPIWMGITLAAMLGQWDQPGAGFVYGLGSMGTIGKDPLCVRSPSLPQGTNTVKNFIPVARISELLLRPGESFTYKGKAHTYADIKLVYWAGGNPFHHHQDLQRLTEAFSKPDTIIFHDSVGTASARHADIIFPATTTLERTDIGASANDRFLIPMQQIVPPYGEARDDYAIFSDLAERIGCEDAFTEGRSADDWQRWLYTETKQNLHDLNWEIPDFDDFMSGDPVALPTQTLPGRVGRLHLDPMKNPLETPSGKIEIFSNIVAGSGLPGHAAWIEPEEWLGGAIAQKHPFQLVANQPAKRLHSQLDFGATSMSAKHLGRECARLNTEDARRLGVSENDTIRLWNDRGSVLACAKLSDTISRSVVQLPTGSWYAPVALADKGITCVNGNPNIVTSDIGASDLSQGCAGQLSLVSIEKWTGETPDPVAHADIIPYEK